MAQPDSNYTQRLIQSNTNTKSNSSINNATIAQTIATLDLVAHPEGGYYVQTDQDSLLIPNPFLNLPPLENATATNSSSTRHASTTIFYLLSPASPVGHFHRNRARTVHTLHWGRGRYVLITPDGTSTGSDERGKGEVESFVVGHDIVKGEKVQWIVEGGRFKASYLLPDLHGPKDHTHGHGGEGGNEEESNSKGGLLISETVVPGFEFADHDFLTLELLEKMVRPEQAEALVWLLRKEEREKYDLNRRG